MGKPDETRPLGRPRCRWEDKINWIFRQWDVGHGLDRAGPGLGYVAGTCECGYEHSGSIKMWRLSWITEN